MDLRYPLFLFFFVIFGIPTFAAQEPTIYDHLRRYGLPIGLFPKGITRYSLNPCDGSFLLNLPQPCNAKFENEVHYDFNVSGVIQFGQIADLSGVSAQDLFLWFPVRTIRVDVPSSGLIYFDVGVVDKQFSLSDVGNNNQLSKSLAKASLPWYGVDFGNGLPNGRFSNGRTVADIIGDKMGLPRPPAFLDSSLTEDIILENGVLYTSGGGEILNETGTYFEDGFILCSRCVLYKSTVEEVSLWGWPLQAAGLLTAASSSKSFTIIKGRVTQWSDGKIGYKVLGVNDSWVQERWSSSVVQLDPGTLILEYRRTVYS